MVLEMMMESVFAVVDIYFVSKLGPDAVATVGLTESLLTVVYAIAVGFSMATSAIVSRRIGEKNPNAAAIAAVQSILVSIVLAVLLSIPGLFLPKELLTIMGASHEIIAQGYRYTAIMIGGNMVIMLLFVINAIFRSAGDATISMRVLWIANLINIVLDPCLIFGLGPFPELGIQGAAIATFTGRGLAVFYQFYLLFTGTGKVKVRPIHLKLNWPIISRFLKLSYGGVGQNIIATASWVVLVRIMAEFGSAALAGYTIAIRIIIFSLLPTWGLSNAAATLVGQNLGANQPDRAEKSVWHTAFANMAFLSVFAILFIGNPEFFIRIFIDDENVIANGIIALRIISFGYLAYGFGMIMPQAFNGAGDTNTPTWINVICFWLMEIPLALLFSMKTSWGHQGVYYAIIISETMLAILSTVLFRRGKWKTKEV